MSLTHEHELSAELVELERQLGELVPCLMSDELHDHLEQSMLSYDSADPTDHAVDNFDDLEIHLGQIGPASMPSDMIARMARAMDRWHEHVPVEEKVVPFGEEADAAPRRLFGGGMTAAAAAVAMLGVVSALVLPRFIQGDQNPASGVVAASGYGINENYTSEADHSVQMEPREAWVIPDSLSNKVVNTSDRGVVMSNDNTPHRCIQVDYVDRIRVQDDQGREN